MTIKFGPAGLRGVKEAVSNLEMYHKLGLKACEIEFTRGIYIKNREDALKIGKVAKQLGIRLSIHASYWINLNSMEEEVIKRSKERILKCCEVGTWLGAKRVVFHPGYYGIKGTKVSFIKPSFKFGVTPDIKEQAYQNIKNQILELQEEIKKKKYTPKLAPEITGKVNVFGDIDEIKKLVEETKCSFCIDFAHILARHKHYMFKEVFNKFKKYKNLHIHFSGIVYGEKGEKHHKKTPKKELRKIILNLPKNKEITIINESPTPIEDSVVGLGIYNKNNQ